MTFGKVRFGRWLALTLCGVALTAGCGDGSSAAPSPTGPVVTSEPTTPAPEPTDEPDPVATDRAGSPLVAPERPAAMDNDDEAGAQAAAEYFMELSGYAVRSQDLSEFSRLCDPASIYCTAVIDEVTADVAAGNYTVGGAKTFTSIAVDPPGEHAFYIVWGTLDRSPFTVFDPSAREVDRVGAESDLDFAIAIERQDDGGWLVRGAEAGVVQPS